MAKAAPDTAVRLSLRGIEKSYGAVHALKGVDFELRPGEVMALLGENGAGKSTLVKILAGLVEPDDGEILVEGEVAALYPTRRSQAAGIAAVHQELSCIPTMSVAENLAIGNESSGCFAGARSLARRARPLLEPVGLAHMDPSSVIEDISVAETQLVEIARVLARDARVVIFDEPTAALSDTEIERVLTVIRRLAEEGRSIVYVTHRLPEVFRIADRVTILRNGESLEPLPVADLDVDQVITLLLGRQLDTMFPVRGTPLAAPRLEVEALEAPGLTAPLSFAVRPGEILGLTGQVGSGASTVVSALAGTLPATRGEVVLDGTRLSLRSRRSGASAGVGYCSGDRKRDGIFAERPTVQNLSAPWVASSATAGFVSARAERERAREICSTFAIDEDRLASPVGTLSGGNQQKVVVGRWLGSDPSLLLLDEPTRGVDVGARAEIHAKLRSLCDEGMSIVMASSDTSEVLGLCDTVATFYRGRMSAIRPHGEWTENAVLREVMHQEGT
jgi:ribose transport system ATP-binding protein